MNASLREFVRQRAENKCEYCKLRQDDTPFARFQVEHVISKQHGGTEDEANLALACPRCNRYKGPNIAGIDDDNALITPLFHPRQHIWEDHFVVVGSIIKGITPIGRVTVQLLEFNDQIRVAIRELILAQENE